MSAAALYVMRGVRGSPERVRGLRHRSVAEVFSCCLPSTQALLVSSRSVSTQPYLGTERVRSIHHRVLFSSRICIKVKEHSCSNTGCRFGVICFSVSGLRFVVEVVDCVRRSKKWLGVTA